MIAFFFSGSVHAGQLQAGFANEELQVPLGVPLAGHSGKTRLVPASTIGPENSYATRFMPASRYRDQLRVKAMYLEQNGQKLLFVSLDIVAMTERFKTSIYRQIKHLGFRRQDVFLMATHTHSGPGTLSKNWFWNRLTMDQYSEEVYQLAVDTTLRSIQRAMAVARPARLLAGRFRADGVQVNRANKPGHIDREGNLLLALSEDGRRLGGMINFAIHGISMPATVPSFSADLPGEVERYLEQQLGGNQTWLFVQGHSGDVNPVARTEPAMVNAARLIGDTAIKQISELAPVASNWQVQHSRLTLGRADIALANCIRAGEVKLARPVAENILGQITATPLSLFFPKSVWISTLVIGDVAFLQWPGELTTDLGLALKYVGELRGFKQVWTLALTNHHLSYFTTPGEYARPEYEACASFYGPEGGYRIVRQHFEHLQNMNPNQN